MRYAMFQMAEFQLELLRRLACSLKHRIENRLTSYPADYERQL